MREIPDSNYAWEITGQWIEARPTWFPESSEALRLMSLLHKLLYALHLSGDLTELYRPVCAGSHGELSGFLSRCYRFAGDAFKCTTAALRRKQLAAVHRIVASLRRELSEIEGAGDAYRPREQRPLTASEQIAAEQRRGWRAA